MTHFVNSGPLLSRYKKVVLHLKHIFRTSSLCRQTFEDVYAQFDEAAMYFELKEMESITHIDSDLATAVTNDTMSDKTVSTVLSTQEHEEPHLVQIW